MTKLLGVTAAGVVGALGSQTIGAAYLGYVGAALALVSVGLAELASAHQIPLIDSSIIRNPALPSGEIIRRQKICASAE